ncbi:hypothetical protein KKG24_04455 [Patescibacteria group bacterium]|nr:hypothetical protein [Patescibacteria group bacterium]
MKKIKLDLIDLIVILSYYFFFVLLILSLFGLFNIYWISGALLIALFIVFVFRRQITFSKYYLYFFIFVPLFFIGFILFKGYFAGDALNYWLLWAREITLQGKMPDFLLNIPIFINCRMPFLPLLFAGVFVFLPFKEIFVVTIPLFFMAATTLLLYKWAREKGVNKQYLIFVVLLFLTNSVTMKYGWDLIQESLIVFFFTAFFYYLEKYQENKSNFYFWLIFLSFVLAIASKLTGLILVFPLFLFLIRNRVPKKSYWLYVIIIFFPIVFWLIRNIVIYGNPMSVIAPFNDLFGGKYSELIRNSLLLYSQNSYIQSDGIFIRLSSIIKDVLFVSPFILLSFYGFWKEKKNQYIIFIALFFLASAVVYNGPNTVTRYLYPLIGILLIYALKGLTYLKSRISASIIFFFSLWGLMGIKVSLSQNSSIASLEKLLSPLISLSQFIFDYRFICVIILSVFFYIFLSRKNHWQYLILLVFSSYLVTTSTIQISWLNIWLPILFLIFIILIWKYSSYLKESFLRKSIVVYIIILLILSSWGLALSFFAINGFEFPKKEAYGILPEVASQIKGIEGDNRDFYTYVSFPTYLSWYHNFKVVGADTFTFYYLIKDLKCCDNYTAQEIHSIFQKNNIKYIVKNVDRPFWQDLFDKVKQEPDLFRLIFEDQGSYLWEVK